MMKTRKERCTEWLKRTNVGNWRLTKREEQAAQLYEFVSSERGRPKEVEDNLALVIYFPTALERDGFVEMLQKVKPGAINRKVP